MAERLRNREVFVTNFRIFYYNYEVTENKSQKSLKLKKFQPTQHYITVKANNVYITKHIN